jgi:hypothetical protein
MLKASAFVTMSHFLLALTTRQALCVTELITAEKRFLIQAPGL